MGVLISIAMQILLISICFVAMFVLLNRDIKVQQRQMEYIIYGCSIANIGMLVEYLAKGVLQVALIGRAIQIMGMSVFCMALLLLTAYVCSIKIPLPISLLLLIGGFFFTLFILLDPYIHMFYSKIEMRSTSWGVFCYTNAGLWDILFALIGVLFPLVSCLIMIFYNALKSSNLLRKRDFLMMSIVYLLLLLVFGLNKFGVLVPEYNVMMALATIIFAYLVFSRWKYQGVDVVAMAAETALESIKGGVISLNQYGEILYFNSAAKKIIPEIGYCIGMPIENLDIEFPDFTLGEETEISIGERKYYLSASEIRDDANNFHGYAILLNDMTEILSLMDMIKNEQKRADEASQVKTMFLANISHEIRTPMNAIMGLSDLIIEESRGRKVYDMAVTIKKAANSLLGLVNNVLDISKLESGKMELQENNYALETLIDDTMKVMAIPAAQQGLQLKCNVDENLPSLLYGDDGKIKQCLINLINNGLKFTDKGYVQLDVSGLVRGDKVALTFMISDTGCGIKREDLKRVFGEFEQVDKILNKNKEGSGLGLAITKQLVELMGGVVDVSSVYGEGTTFTVRLSQTVVNAMPISEIREVTDDMDDEPKMFAAPDVKLLVVDDNKVNLMVARGLIEPYKVQIDTAASGEEACNMVKEKNYDVIMMDHMMPGMDGVQAIELIKEYYDGIGVETYSIALTANAFGEMREMFLSHGFQDFLSKPIEKNKLHQVLLRAVTDEKREYTDEVLAPAGFTEDELAELFMEEVDVRSAFKLHGCTQAEYLELLELYYNEGMGKIEDIKNAYENKDWKNYEILTHGLKSSSANMGANILSENAKKHEFASKDPENVDINFIDQDYPQLISKYQKVLNEAKRVLEKQKEKNGAGIDVKLAGMVNDELKRQVEEAYNLSLDFKSKEAADVIDNLLKYQLDDDIEEKLVDIRMKFKLYDDDKAEELLEKLLQELSR